MKKMRRFASLLLAMVMVLSMTVSAFADTATITVPSEDGHTYDVYQIFTGDYANGVLSNVKWGANAALPEGVAVGDAVSEEVLNELTALNGKSDTEKLATITNYVDLNSTPQSVSKDAALSVVPGYYLLKDNAIGTDDAYTTYIVEVVDDVIVSRKAAKPTVDKQVSDEAEDAETNGESWGETADHEINETFQFKLIANITGDEDYEDYDKYRITFHDTWTEGITYEDIESVVVVSGGNTITLNERQYGVLVDETGRTLTVTIYDLKAIDGVDLTKDTTVTVIYNAHLNENAVIGNEDENWNEVHLEYSNNPNWVGPDWDKDNDGELDEDEEDDYDEYDEEEPTGETEKDRVWVFTYEVKVNKVDGQDTTKLLSGAKFKMQNAAGKWLVVDNDGKVQEWIDSEDDASVLTSDDKGVFTIIGLDHGTYTLKEIEAPAGYNLLDGTVTVEVEAEHEELTADTAETIFTVNKADEITIENNAGATLPETGGMGTTLFYVIGATLVLGAAVVMVTRKRMSAN